MSSNSDKSTTGWYSVITEPLILSIPDDGNSVTDVSVCTFGVVYGKISSLLNSWRWSEMKKKIFFTLLKSFRELQWNRGHFFTVTRKFKVFQDWIQNKYIIMHNSQNIHCGVQIRLIEYYRVFNTWFKVFKKINIFPTDCKGMVILFSYMFVSITSKSCSRHSFKIIIIF